MVHHMDIFNSKRATLLPFGMILTQIFQHLVFLFENKTSISLKPTNQICMGTLHCMRCIKLKYVWKKHPEAHGAAHDDSIDEEAVYAQATSMPPILIHNPPTSPAVGFAHCEPSSSTCPNPSMQDLCEAI